MSGLMWLIFILILALLVLSLFWFVWKLRHFSQSNHQTIADDKLLQIMLRDEVLSKEVKEKLVRKSNGMGAEGGKEDGKEQPAPDETEKEGLSS